MTSTFYSCLYFIALIFLVHTHTPTEFDNPFSFTENGLNICHLNIHHVLPKLSELRYFLTQKQCNVDILCLCETFLSNSIQSRELSVEGFNIIRRDRINKIGGGLLIYTSDQTKTVRRDDLEVSSIESIWFGYL